MNLPFSKSSKQLYEPRTYLIQYNDTTYRFLYMKSCRVQGYTQDFTEDILDKFLPKKRKKNSFYSSISRTKRNIRELALCNNFSYFATITINGDNCNRYDLEICQFKLKQIFHYYKRKYKDFIFLFITEKHKDGAFHFHGLIGGLPNSAFITNQNGYLELEYITKKLGYNSFSSIKSYTKCCNYITKYITKECVKNSHNQIYFCSRGLKKADKVIIPHADYFLPFKYKNDYCFITDFSINDLSLNQKLKFMEIFEKNKGI